MYKSLFILIFSLCFGQYSGYNSGVSKSWVLTQIENAFIGLSVDRLTEPPIWTFSGYVKSLTVNHAFGGFQDSAVVLDCTEDQWESITNTSKNLFTTIQYDGITVLEDTINILFSGDYSGTVTVTMSADPTVDWRFRIYNITQDKQEGFWIGGTSTGDANYLPLTIPVHLIVDAEDKIVFQLMNETNDTDATLKSCVYLFTYTHEKHE